MGATEAVHLHPDVHESSVELLLWCVFRPLLLYQVIFTASRPYKYFTLL